MTEPKIIKFSPHPLVPGHGFGRDGTIGKCECGQWSTLSAESIVGFDEYCDHISAVVANQRRFNVWWRKALRRLSKEG